MKKIFFGLVWVIFSMMVLSGCEKKKETLMNKEKDIVANQDSENINVPKSLTDCDGDLLTREKACNNKDKGDFCSYYKGEDGNRTKYYNLQFTNECVLCHTHGKIGYTWTKDGVNYTHLGYKKGMCTQGNYINQ